MPIEILFVGVLSLISALLINGFLAFLYRKNRPTRLFKNQTSGMVLIALTFFSLGKIGPNHYLIVSLIFLLMSLALLANFIFIASRVSQPLNRIVYGLTTGGDQVDQASEKVASASQSLAEGAAQQAAGLEETSTSLGQMAEMTHRKSDHVQGAKDRMEEVNRIVEDVKAHMDQMAQTIDQVTRSSEETGKIIQTIDEIQLKSAYFKRVGELVVACGAYE